MQVHTATHEIVFISERAADERDLYILELADAGMRFDRIDRALSLPKGCALRVWLDIAEATGDDILVH